MSKLKITPGKVSISKVFLDMTDRILLQTGTEPAQKYVAEVCGGYPEEQRRANASLYAEAHNVANETGKTPRELMEQRDKALKLLRELRDAVSEEATKPGMKFVDALISKHTEAGFFLASLTSNDHRDGTYRTRPLSLPVA